MTDALFDLDHLPPIRKGAAGYLAVIAGHTYDGLTIWALAPIDPHIRARHQAPAETTEFVWLHDGHTLHWALVDLDRGDVIELDPRPVDQSVWHAPEVPP